MPPVEVPGRDLITRRALPWPADDSPSEACACTSAVEPLLELLPTDIAASLAGLEPALSDIVLDKGRRPQAWCDGRRVFLGGAARAVLAEDLEAIVSRLGGFGTDNRAGLEAQLQYGVAPRLEAPRAAVSLEASPAASRAASAEASRSQRVRSRARPPPARRAHSRISAIRNRAEAIIGLTMRVGRHVGGNAAMIEDLLFHAEDASLLFLGEP